MSAGLGQTSEMTMASPLGVDDVICVVGIESVAASWVDSVIGLGDANRNRLGPMPYSGFREAAANGHIVLAIRTSDDGGESLVGYCLYAPTVRADWYVRIAHLCLAQDARGSGVARRLIDSVMERCPDRLGLRLKCRDDWEAAAKWPSLGFEPVRRRTGRGKTQEPMTEWVRRNDSVANLLTAPEEDPDQLEAGVDNNVYCDLFGTSSTRRQRFSGTVALLAADQQIRLARPFSLTAELNKTPNQRDRDALLHTAAVSGMKVLNGDRTEIRSLRDALLGAVPNDVLAKDASMKMDATLIAETILGGADLFLTRDQNAITYLGPTAAEGRGFTVLHPNELPAFVDRRADAASYLPAQLEETQFQVSRGDATTWNPQRIGDLLDNDSGERKADFRALIGSLAEQTAGTDDRQMMLTPSGDVLAAWAVQDKGTSLEVLLLRVQGGPLLPTIARQISRTLRRRAATSGLTTVRVVDSHLPSAIATELERDGFRSDAETSSLTATVLTAVGTWAAVRAIAEETTDSRVVLPSSLSSAAEASELERILWPAKILDPDLPTYLVPIRGVFADDLLGHVPTLLARPAELGLSREHVYYRSGRSRPAAPGRILWYSSLRDQAVVACSRLVESVTGTPEVLHREFANIGVLKLEQVRSVADKRGRVNALRFADTEIFARPVPLSRVQELSGGAARLTIQSPVRVDPDWFRRLYEEGTRR